MRLACTALAALVLAACGGGGDGDVEFPDAGIRDDAGVLACNPVSQTGCAAGEKCALILDDVESGASHVDCISDGDKSIGASCTEPSDAGRSDDCAKGGDCYRGTCHHICTTLNDQCPDGSCVSFQDAEGDPIPIEICLPSCDLLAQDCPNPGEGCYLAGKAVCVGAGTADVGDPCVSANSCRAGTVCVGSAMSGYFCRNFCGPWKDCFDADGAIVSCGCGSTLACGAADICFAIGDGMGGAAHDTAGVCIPATDADCDCLADPICPPAS